MGNRSIDIDVKTALRKAGKLPIDNSPSSRAERPNSCGAMTLQSGDSGWGNQSAPQKLLQLVGCREKPTKNVGPDVQTPRNAERTLSGRDYIHWTKSPHFSIAASPVPHGMIGTEEVEFFGDPSISLSE